MRGPLTAQALGLPRALAITDPAAMVGRLLSAAERKLHAVLFMPHFRTAARAFEQGVDLSALCADAGIAYIDPSSPVERVLDALRASDLLVAEAMHGAIVADALRVPWVPVQLYDHIRSLKWWDWCGSLLMEYAPMIYAPSPEETPAAGLATFLSAAAASRPSLSSDTVLSAALDRLQEQLRMLRSDPGGGSLFMGSPSLAQDPSVLLSVPWLHEIQLSISEIAAFVPQGETYILVDDEQWGGGEIVAGRRHLPFLERDGIYWGPPPDSATACAEIERMRADGAAYLVFARPCFWWLDYYTAFEVYLRSRHTLVHESERLWIFGLRG